METDFSILEQSDFEQKLRTYLGFLYTSGQIQTINESAAVIGSASLAVDKWQAFRFDQVFRIEKGYYNKKPPLQSLGQEIVPFIGATEYQNGVTSYHDVEDVLTYSRNGEENHDEPSTRKLFSAACVTVSNNGSVGNAFYQPRRFTCSHDVNPLYLRNRTMTPEIGLFLATVIELDRYRWGYGRKWRPKRMPKSIIKLPVTVSGEPDWDAMTNFVRGLSHSANLI